MNIKQLNTGVISKIRSFADVSNVAQCVYELVCNSLDAQSTAIAVRINLLKFRIQVADNGSGISRQNMERLGTRYATNKCQTVKDLEGHLKTYGFRGESLASIAEMSRAVTITSRYKTSNDTFSKTLSRDGQSEVKPEKSRASVGTTVTVLKWLSTAPVRQQRIVQEIELEEVKKQLESLIIINPGTSFTLRNDVTGMLIINSPKHADIVEAFHRLHPEAGGSFSLLKVSKGKICIELLIEKELALTKEWQFLYVNKRPVKSARISQRFQKGFHANKHTKRYPVFIMNIKCPQLCVDSRQKSARSEVEFTCWTQVLACVDKLIKVFLGAEMPKPPLALPQQKQFDSGISQLKGAVQATAYKRKTTAISDEAGATKLRRLQDIEDMTQTTGDYGIEDSAVQLPPAKALRPKMKKPLGIVAVSTKRSPPKQTSLERFDQRSVYSRLNTDENRGKDLILDMFLKSTQVFKEQSEDASQATIEESNYILENNIADTARGINATMSISVNVKKRRAPRTAGGHSQWPQKPPTIACSAQQCSRALIKRRSLDEQAPELIGHSRAVCHKSVQTSQKLNYGQSKSFQTNSSLNLNDDYTILINTEAKEHKYLFARRQKDAQVEDTTAIRFEPLKLCHCEHREGNLFNFREVDGGCKSFAEWWPVLQGSEAKNKQPRGYPKPDLFQTAMTKRKGESEARCTTSLLFRGLKRQSAANAPSGLLCMQSPYFHNENKREVVSTVSPFKQFRPPFRSTQINSKNNREVFSPYFQHNTTGHDPNKQLLKKQSCRCNLCPRRYHVFNRPTVANRDQRTSTSAELAQLLNSKNDIQFKKPICGTTCSALREKETANQSPKGLSWAHLAAPQCKNTQNNWFNFSSSPDIFSSEFHSQNDAEALSKLNALCDLEQFGLLPSRTKTQSPIEALEISLPSAQERHRMIEQELLNARRNSNSYHGEDLRPALQDESRFIMDSQNEWLKCFNKQGGKFFVNRRTGMATVKSPVRTQTNFAFEQRLDFVPKGMSPVLNQHKKVEGILSQNAKNKLHSLILEGYEDELMRVKWRNCLNNDQKAFFEEIYREKSRQYEQCIPRVSNMKAQPHKVNFSRSVFESLEVIGQLDQKFLVAHERLSDLLVLFDQHAVDERIRVERFLKEYKGLKIAHKEKLTIFLPHNDLALLQNHSDYLDSVGLGVQFFTNGLHITHIPLCIHEKFTGQGERQHFNDLLNALVKEAVDFLKSTRGSTGLSIPKIVQDVINLKACRGAVKFGDALSAEECARLLQDLALCQLPFQCAHGRPTLTPVVTLQRLQNSEQFERPHLRKLLQCTEQLAGR